jgi:2,3-bisphosphoglycerate-dependent phosphoglycerate mutase
VTELLLVRHGETDWNREHRFQGQADPPLNDAGREQARELADRLSGEDIAAIYTSDLLRARETAEILAAALNADVVALRELREIDVGSWQGLTWPEIEERLPDGAARWHQDGHGWDSGETYEQLGARIVAALGEIASNHPRQRVLVVAHGGTVRATRAFVEGVSVAESRRRSPAIGNCQVFRVVTEDGTWRGLD